MKLKINKASDLSSISVLPPHARRPSVVPSASESSVFGRSQVSQVRSQQQSQQSFSQGLSSQQATYSQLSQSSLDELVPNEQRLSSQERENLAKKMSCLPHINYTREESQLQLSNPSTNYMRKWPVPENKYKSTEELEHKIGMVETLLSRQGMILDSIQSDIMQVNRGTKEILMEMESLRPKLVSNEEQVQSMNKEREGLKASLEGTFKSMFEEMREDKYQENIRDLFSLLRAVSNKLEASILQLQTDLSKTLTKEIQKITPCPDCHGQKRETAPVNPPKVHSQHEIVPVDPPKVRSRRETAPLDPSKGMNGCNPPREVKLRKKEQKTTMLPKVEIGSWTTVKNNQTCMKQTIPIRSHKQNEAFQQKIPIRRNNQNEALHQERECRVVTIESDEDIDSGFSCLLEENGTYTGIHLLDEAKEESARILRKARRRKRKHFKTIIID